MGTLVAIIDGGPVVRTVKGPDCVIRVAFDGVRLVDSLCRLSLSRATPLTPYTDGFVDLPRVQPFARGRRGGPPSMRVEDTDLPLTPGVWECGIGTSRTYLLVSDALEVAIVSHARAFVALGALDELVALGLGDAAVALSAGDYDLACAQWIAQRQG